MELVDRVKSKIKELIKEKGWSIYELANKAELTEACIRNWYTKRNYTPSLEAIEKICKAFDIPATEIVRDKNEKPIALTAQETEIIKNWRKLDGKQRNSVKVQMEAFLHK